jgi:hypothetical protein
MINELGDGCFETLEMTRWFSFGLVGWAGTKPLTRSPGNRKLQVVSLVGLHSQTRQTEAYLGVHRNQRKQVEVYLEAHRNQHRQAASLTHQPHNQHGQAVACLEAPIRSQPYLW